VRECKILDLTQNLVANRPKPVTYSDLRVKLKAQYGIDISEQWLGEFARGKYQNPNIRTVIALYEIFSGHELAI
jgi:hypothetical protein